MTAKLVAALARSNVPAELRRRDQWVLWRLESAKGRGSTKQTKVPYTTSGRHASSTDPGTWCSLDEALMALECGSFTGIGFVFDGNGHVGIDLDHCRDPGTDVIDDWARAILDDLAGYTEVSPSGTGVHVIVAGALPGKGRKHKLNRKGAHPDAAVEIYDRGRYFTVTADRLRDYPSAVVDRQSAVTAIYARYSVSPRPAEKTSRPATPTTVPDAQLIQLAMAAKTGAAFGRLWSGDTSAHGGDDSAADLALCNMLAFYCGPDPARIDAVFRQSGLHRTKWERKDYRDATIAKALEGRTEFYRWGTKPDRRDCGATPNHEPDDYVLIPGQHIDDQRKLHEVGTDDFATTVIGRLPVGALYRMDFVVGELIGETGKRRFVACTEQHLRTVIDGVVRLAKWVGRKEHSSVRVFVACSRDQAGLLLAAAGASQRIPELRLLVHHPVYLPGLELARPGWNEGGGVFYDEPPSLRGIRPRPDGAIEVLRDLVVDFPFMDEASRQNMFGAMITLIVRPGIQGRVPFHLVMSSLERTGKGKLIDTAIGGAVLGHAIAPMQPGRTEEEREKRVTSLLLQGETVVHLDNLPVGDVLDSPSLASLATSWPLWRGRRLGASCILSLVNNLVVFLSGNNPRTTGEIAKRTVPIVLEPQDDHPEDRADFVHADAEGYARMRRRAVLEALLGIVESWKRAGRCPAPRRRAMGGFEQWAETIGGVMAHAGLSQWMSNYRTWVRGSDEWTADAEVLVAAWAERFGLEPVRAKQVLALIVDLEIFPAVTGKPTDAARWSCVGKRVMTPLTGRPVGRWQVIADGKGASKRYRLREHLPAGATGAAGGQVEPDPRFGREGSEG